MKICTYYRVSTAKQGQSGLGLEAQVAAVELYKKANAAVELASFREVESGKNIERLELAKALAHCRRTKSVLVVAKIDRLARNVAFLSALMESEVQFVACDNPTASRLTIHILAAVAEDEARRISQRTKDALAAKKARGVLLGSARPGHWEGKEEVRLAAVAKARVVSAKSRAVMAQRFREDLRCVVAELVEQGLDHSQIASKLNERGFLTRTGKSFNRFHVLRLLKLLGGRNEASA